MFIKMILKMTLLFSALPLFNSCNGQDHKLINIKTEQKMSINIGDTVSDIGNNIGCIIQDKSNNYWFASNGNGVYFYDGRTLKHITTKDGLLSNFVLKIEEDMNGDLWFSTRDGVCKFNGISFTNYTDKIKNAPTGKLYYSKGGLFFGHLDGVCYFDGFSFTGFEIHPNNYTSSPSNRNRPYSIYSTITDNLGRVWFGTQEKGVCRYDGDTFTFFIDHGLDKAAVRTLFQDKAGNIWAGNNGAGLFKFNGIGFINFTDEKGLANRDFLNKSPGKEGTLARPWTMNDDEKGNLWIGTIDAGVWMYDGINLTNYTTKDGLTGNSIWTIYKDKKGELWFVTDGQDICKFNGNRFSKFDFH